MSTPEGKVKDEVKKLLTKYKIYPAKDAGNFPKDAEGWYWMPVKNSMGISGIPDVVGHYLGYFFSVETKAPKKKPTGFQALQIAAIAASGGAVFIVDGPESLKEFEVWLHMTQCLVYGRI